MLHINPSMLLENYALNRADILYEKIDFIPELIKELYRTMKPSGIGLAVFPEDEKMQDSLAQFSKAGFDFIKVGEN